MSLEDHKAASRHVLEMWGSGGSVPLEDVLAPAYVNHQMPDVQGGTSAKTLEEWKSLVADFHASFSETTVEILAQVAEGDLVATRWQLSGTSTSDFRGYTGTGKTATWTGVHTDRFENGKIVESWVDWDKYRFLDELGLL